MWFAPNRGHKTCSSKNLSVKIRELHSNQILQTMAYIAHCHKHLASFLSPKPFNQSTGTYWRLQGAMRQWKNRCDTDSKFISQITHIKGNSQMQPSNLQHVIGISSIKHICVNKEFNLRGNFGLPNSFAKVERGCT